MKLQIPVVHVTLSEKGLITFSTVIICGTLIGCGHDSIIGYTLLAVVCGYYGITLTLPSIIKWRNGNGKRKGS